MEQWKFVSIREIRSITASVNEIFKIAYFASFKALEDGTEILIIGNFRLGESTNDTVISKKLANRLVKHFISSDVSKNTYISNMFCDKLYDYIDSLSYFFFYFNYVDISYSDPCKSDDVYFREEILQDEINEFEGFLDEIREERKRIFYNF